MLRNSDVRSFASSTLTKLVMWIIGKDDNDIIFIGDIEINL